MSPGGGAARQATILFLGANPSGSTRLALDREVREIDDRLRASEHRDAFRIEQAWAVRASDLQARLLHHRPAIVHFSGHGDRTGELVLEDAMGNAKRVGTAALGTLFRVLRRDIRCVLLNACFSEDQARAIAEHVDCVVGMTTAVNDSSAIAFAGAFYQALGYGEDVQTAFELGCIQMDLTGPGDADVGPAGDMRRREFGEPDTPLARDAVGLRGVDVVRLIVRQGVRAQDVRFIGATPPALPVVARHPPEHPQGGGPAGEELAKLSTDVENALRRAPALAAALAAMGYAEPDAQDLPRDVARALVRRKAKQVATHLAALARKSEHRAAARSLFWTVLPLAGDWNDVLEKARAAGASDDVLELQLRTETVAEIVLARVEERCCLFAPGGEFPQGAAHVPLPATEHAPFFDVDARGLVEAVLMNLWKERRPDEPLPGREVWTGIKKRCRDAGEFMAVAAATINVDALLDKRRYLLFIDALLDSEGKDLDVAWARVQAALTEQLPGLRLVRLRGRQSEMNEEAYFVPLIGNVRDLA